MGGLEKKEYIKLHEGRLMMRKIEKPWGHELIWAETDKYVGKILFIKEGEKLSRQYHVKKEETLLVKRGEMRLEIGDDANRLTLHMHPDNVFHITPGTIHRMVAVTDVEVVEVSTPELNDVVRLEDSYGRAQS